MFVLLRARLLPRPARGLTVTSLLPNFLTSSTPQTLHLKYSAAPAQAALCCHRAPPSQPTSADRIAPPATPHSPVRFAQDQFHRVAASREIILLPALSLPSAFHAAQPAFVRPGPQSHRPQHHARSPIAPFPRTNAPPLQIPGMVRAASISGCASIRIPALPNSKSHSDGTPPRPAPAAPSHKTPPCHLRWAPNERCTF